MSTAKPATTAKPAGRKVIITCAVTGSVHTPTMTPYLPITPDQIAAVGRGVSGPFAEVLLPDCGHAPHREQEAATIRAVVGFLAGLEGTGRFQSRRA